MHRFATPPVHLRLPSLAVTTMCCSLHPVLPPSHHSRLCPLSPRSPHQVTLAGFRSGKFNVLVATDVAARGLDISGVELVVQLEPPKDPEVRGAGRDRAGVPAEEGSSLVGCQWYVAVQWEWTDIGRTRGEH